MFRVRTLLQWLGLFVMAFFNCPAKTSPTPTISPSPAQTAALSTVEASATFDVAKIAAAARPAVALIVVWDKAGKATNIGTGFFISRDGKLVTNAHVLQGADRAEAKLENGANYNILGILKAAVDKDLVIAKAEAKDVPSLSIASGQLPEPGTRIVVVGSPVGLEGTVSEGIVSGQRTAKPNDQWLQITAAISPGSSGSPVINAQGQVIGVSTFVIEKAQSVNFARPAEYILDLLKQVGEPTEPEPFWKLAKDSKNIVLNDPEFLDAEKAFTENDPAQALKILNKLQPKYAENAPFLLKLGLVYDSLNLLDDAVQTYQHALKLDPTNGVGWTDLALTYIKLHKTTEAKDAALQAVKQVPDFGPAWGVLGFAYQQDGRYAESADALQKAARLTPKEPDVWRNLSRAYAELNETAKREEADKTLDELVVRPNRTAKESVAPSAPSANETSPPASPENRRTAVVTVPPKYELHIRSEHDANSALIKTLHKDDRLFLEQGQYRKDNEPESIAWQRVTSMDGQTGWVNSAYLSPSETTQGAPAASGPVATPSSENGKAVEVVTADESKGLHVRSAPDAKSAVVEKLHTHDRIFIAPGRIRNNEPPHPTVWQHVTTMDGVTGWIASEYLSGSQGNSEGNSEQDHDVWDLFERWMLVSTGADATQEASLYADPVDYLDLGMISRQQLADELRGDLQKWPKQFNRVSRGPDLEKISDSEWRVSFELTFDVRNPVQAKRVTGVADLTWTVHKRQSGGVEISSAKENVKTRTYYQVNR
jgi:tetratricopeptide (TPR) repeat protein/SH3-like domain-containing protein